METMLMSTETSKTNEPHKFVLDLSQKLELRSSNKHSKLLYLLHMEKYKEVVKSNKLKII